MIGALRRLSLGFLGAFTLLALALGFWSIVLGNSLLARDDNPRLVLAEQRIQRGLIVDRNDNILAETRLSPVGGRAERLYPYPVASPVVGYYSLRYGVGGIEAEYDDLLRGDLALTPTQHFLNTILHRYQVGGDIRLTLDATIQQAAADALQSHTGAVVVLSVPSGEVLAMVSHPTFDALVLDESWDELVDDPAAPLLNRATQGLYQPGAILQSVLLATALNSHVVELSSSYAAMGGALLDGTPFPCAGRESAVVTLADAYREACPAPFRFVSYQLGASHTDAALERFGLLAPPVFALPTEAADLATPPARSDLALTGLGQSSLTVSPLQMAVVAAALADNGQIPALQLVSATRMPGQEWQSSSPDGSSHATISPAAVRAVTGVMAQAVHDGPARLAAVLGHTVYGHTGLAVAGPEGVLNAWFIGFVPTGPGTAVAIAVLVEDTGNATVAARVAGAVLQTCLENYPETGS